MKFIRIKNSKPVSLSEIPELNYSLFYETNIELIENNPQRHCVSYFGYKNGTQVKLICCIADDETHEILVSSCQVKQTDELESFSKKCLCFEKFEREIHENFGLKYIEHPWLKPVRYAENRYDKTQKIANYPFYNIDSEELHEVGVGPIHAGIIEPGHFRFICNGEQILHLEIQLGFQHKGIEKLLIEKKRIQERSTLAESIAGDTTVGHSVAFAQLWEGLNGFTETKDIAFARTVALEIERIAIHTGDLSAICTDIAYQLGSSVFGRLRTPFVNFMQEWCGNRLSKGLIRPGKNKFPFTPELGKRLLQVIEAFEPDFNEMAERMFSISSVLSRLERTGVVSNEDALSIGTVGMAARMTNLNRDIRVSHPTALYAELNHVPILKKHGDVYSRAQIRRREIEQSIQYLRELIKKIPSVVPIIEPNNTLKPDSFCISLVEGWRGEICHCSITDSNSEMMFYKITDPSFHNWLALALAVRNNEISDFPICNKSFNLSYTGHDL